MMEKDNKMIEWIKRYVDLFEMISHERQTRWDLNTVEKDDDTPWIYNHRVGICSDREAAYSTIRLDYTAMYQSGPEYLAKKYFNEHFRNMGNIVCSGVPKQFTPFIRPKI